MDAIFLDRLTNLFTHHSITSAPSEEIAERGFRVPHIFPERQILFIGHNPSFRQGDQSGGECLYHPSFQDSYFKHYFQFAEMIGQKDNWNYLDMFYYRHTEQAFTSSDADWVPFLCQQLVITQDIVEYLQPKIIVVCNTAAAGYWGLKASDNRTQGVWMGYTFEWDDHLGVDRIQGVASSLGREPELEKTQLINVPVLFSGFNQYKSVHDKKRLEWHIQYIIRNIM